MRFHTLAASGLMLGLLALPIPAQVTTQQFADPQEPPAQPTARMDWEQRHHNGALLFYRYWMAAEGALFRPLEEAFGPDREGWEDEELHAAIAEAQAHVRGLMKAADQDDADWAVEWEDGIYALLPHLQRLRATARILRADARRLAKAGELDAAAERIAAMFGTARHSVAEPVVISSLVAIAIEAFGAEEATWLAKNHELSGEALQTLLQALSRIDMNDPGRLREGLVGEGRWVSNWVDLMLSREDVAAEMARAFGAADPGTFDWMRDADEGLVHQQANELRRFYLRAISALDSDDPVAEMQDLSDRVEAMDKESSLLPHFAPALGKAVQSSTRAQGELSELRDLLLQELNRVEKRERGEG